MRKKENLMQNQNEYKGYSLFNDIDDVTLRNRNRGVVLANIAEGNTKDKKVSPKGASLILGYFSNILPAERRSVQDCFVESMRSKGYVLGA